jgi:hypothetical protein
MLPERLQNKTWKTVDGELQSRHLMAILGAIRDGLPRESAVTGAMSASDKRVGRAMDLLKREGLVHYDAIARRFRLRRSLGKED